MTYRELKTHLNELSEESLNLRVRYINEEKAEYVADIWILEEDYINPSGEGIEPVSTYKDDPDFDVDQESISFAKGTILLVGPDSQDPEID